MTNANITPALPSSRYRITWHGRQLAILAAASSEAAIAALLAERGYGYLTSEVLQADLLLPIQTVDAFGNVSAL